LLQALRRRESKYLSMLQTILCISPSPSPKKNEKKQTEVACHKKNKTYLHLRMKNNWGDCFFDFSIKLQS